MSISPDLSAGWDRYPSVFKRAYEGVRRGLIVTIVPRYVESEAAFFLVGNANGGVSETACQEDERLQDTRASLDLRTAYRVQRSYPIAPMRTSPFRVVR